MRSRKLLALALALLMGMAASACAEGDWHNILLLGTDERTLNESARTDAMIIASINRNTGEEIFQKLIYPAKNIRLVICGHISAPDQWERGVAFSMDKNSIGKSVAQMAFNTQAIGGGWHGSGGDGWLRLLEFMPDRKTVKATTFSPLFAISPSTRHLAWKRDKRNEFIFTIE